MTNHPMIPILMVITALVLIAVKWAFLPFVPWRQLPRNRVRHLRLRLHLRLHPGAGHATVAELWLRWGRFAVFRRSGRARRSLSFWQRAARPGQRVLDLPRPGALPARAAAAAG